MGTPRIIIIIPTMVHRTEAMEATAALATRAVEIVAVAETGGAVEINFMVSQAMERMWRVVFFGWLGWIAMLSAKARDWQYADTGNFEVITNARVNEAKMMVGRLEQFRENFLRFFPSAKCREPRVTVVIFESDRDFRPFKPVYKGRPAELAGVFQGYPDEVVIALSAEGDVEQITPIIFHEYVHMLMHAHGLRLPPWLNEGMAELYSTMEVEGDQLKIGRDIPHHLMLLNRSTLMPLAQLFSVSQNSSDYNEGTRRGLFYAQSWALLHYWDCGLLKEPKQREKKGRFLELLQMDLPAERCMQEAFGQSLANMQDQLNSYVRGGKYYVQTMKVEKIDYAERVKFRAATEFERDVALANLKWRLQRNGDATYRMLQFAESKPDSARPFELLAAMAMLDGEHKRALDYWRQAAERKTTNPYVYEQLARDTLRQSLSNVSLNFRFPEETVAELRHWLDRALELEPNYAEAWDWLALTEAFAPKMRTSIVNKVIARGNSLGLRPRYVAAIAMVAVRLKNFKEAEVRVNSLMARPDVMSQQSGIGKMPPVNSSLAGGRSASPWMQPPEMYPDVRDIARAIQLKLDSEKPAADETSAAPVKDARTGNSSIKPIS